MRNKTKHSLYVTYKQMRGRCENQNNPAFHNYGGRGIKVCERWKDSFDAFVSDMGERPFKMTLERRDTNKDYEPSNCCWATQKQQMRNTRAKRVVIVDGVEKHINDLAAELGIHRNTLAGRIKNGLPPEKIISRERQTNPICQERAVARAAELRKERTACKRGHEFTPENTYAYNGARSCKACKSAWDKFLRYKKTRPLEEFL